MNETSATILPVMYERLFQTYGPQHWWPGENPVEVVIGAILTQNTAWTNVEKAIENLKQANCLSFDALRNVNKQQLEEWIRPAGTYRIKADRLKAFVDELWQSHDGSLESMLGGELDLARQRLLAIRGIGPETADAILLYAGNRATFVVDAYTKRILRRHHVIEDKEKYETVRNLFHQSVTLDVQVYNEFHALLVEVGKRHCGTKAKCEGCPLVNLPHDELR